MLETMLAIEFGGGFVSIYKKNGGLLLKENSLLAVKKEGQDYKILAFGNDAKKIAKIGDETINIFSPFSEGKVKSFDYAVLLLKYFLKKVDLKKSFLNSLSTIVCVPVGTGEDDKKMFLKLCHACEIEKVRFIPSVYAIAFKEGLNEFTPKYKMIVDMGASTTDVAVLNYFGINYGSTLSLGGRSMNAGISNMLKEKYNIIVSMDMAEKIKEELGTLFESDISTMTIQARVIDRDEIKTITLKAKEIKDVLLPYFNEILTLVEMTLNVCPNEILAEIGRYGILISGGVSKIAGLEKFFASRLKLPISICEDNDDATILGAGILLKEKEILNKIAF